MIPLLYEKEVLVFNLIAYRVLYHHSTHRSQMHTPALTAAVTLKEQNPSSSSHIGPQETAHFEEEKKTRKKTMMMMTMMKTMKMWN